MPSSRPPWLDPIQNHHRSKRTGYPYSVKNASPERLDGKAQHRQILRHEVIVGVERRRFWPDEMKLSILREGGVGGATVPKEKTVPNQQAEGSQSGLGRDGLGSSLQRCGPIQRQTVTTPKTVARALPFSAKLKVMLGRIARSKSAYCAPYRCVTLSSQTCIAPRSVWRLRNLATAPTDDPAAITSCELLSEASA